MNKIRYKRNENEEITNFPFFLLYQTKKTIAVKHTLFFFKITENQKKKNKNANDFFFNFLFCLDNTKKMI